MDFTKRKLYFTIMLVMAISVVIEVIFAHPHGHYWWSTVPGADILLGFVGAWILILFSKKLLGPLLHHDENYYDRGDDDDK